MNDEEILDIHPPVKVPLVIYIGEERRIIGEAIVVGNRVEAYITPADEPEVLCRMVENGLIQNVSVAFNAPPAIPVGENGDIRWVKNY